MGALGNGSPRPQNNLSPRPSPRPRRHSAPEAYPPPPNPQQQEARSSRSRSPSPRPHEPPISASPLPPNVKPPSLYQNGGILSVPGTTASPLPSPGREGRSAS